MLVCLSTYTIQNQHDEKHYQDHSRSFKASKCCHLRPNLGLPLGRNPTKISKNGQNTSWTDNTDFVNNSLFPYHKIGGLNCSKKSIEKPCNMPSLTGNPLSWTAELPKSKEQSRQIHDPCPALHVNNFVASDTPRPHGCCICCLVSPIFQGKHIGVSGVGESKCYRFCSGRELEEGRKLQDMGSLGDFAHGSKLGHSLGTIDLGWIGTSSSSDWYQLNN